MKNTRRTIQTTLNFVRCILVITALHLIAPAFAETPKHYVRVGTTVFVSGHFKYWTRYIFSAKFKEEKTEQVVFVNIESERQENPAYGTWFRSWVSDQSLSIVVVGRCDLFCARMLMTGKERSLAPGAYIDLQVPIDWETKKADGRWPNTQFALFEKNPLAASLKDIYYEAFTQGGLTGGLQVTSTQAQFCKARNPDFDCKTYPLDSTRMGLTTSATPTLIEVPPELAR